MLTLRHVDPLLQQNEQWHQNSLWQLQIKGNPFIWGGFRDMMIVPLDFLNFGYNSHVHLTSSGKPRSRWTNLGLARFTSALHSSTCRGSSSPRMDMGKRPAPGAVLRKCLRTCPPTLRVIKLPGEHSILNTRKEWYIKNLVGFTAIPLTKSIQKPFTRLFILFEQSVYCGSLPTSPPYPWFIAGVQVQTELAKIS